MQKKYKHIFFDLDHTLWDFEKNAEETLVHLYHHYKLKSFGVKSPDIFIEKYREINAQMWVLYNKREITKDVLRVKRFEDAFMELGVDQKDIPHGIWDLYLEICPTKSHLFDGAKDLLEYLNGKYTLSIITNGFEETQHRKLKYSDIGKYFTHMLSSEKFGIAKPDPKIFNHLLQLNKASNTETIMIGDNMETDIKGAKAAAIDHVFFNPDKSDHNHDVEKEIHHLLELKEII
jgi:putative hydrolase of the HAD superfamily